MSLPGTGEWPVVDEEDRGYIAVNTLADIDSNKPVPVMPAGNQYGMVAAQQTPAYAQGDYNLPLSKIEAGFLGPLARPRTFNGLLSCASARQPPPCFY
jgi:photosystem II stability/assembly factor-like uncharacterized protein